LYSLIVLKVSQRSNLQALLRIFATPQQCIGSIAQWLGCRCLADGLSSAAPDLWLTGDQFVGKLSAMGQPNCPT